ncbi:hypothetical protein SETIT_9G403800v2 [Setaria italica]|nr:hypothetical protein SETIT_9G403800v2 [Setaria italica]
MALPFAQVQLLADAENLRHVVDPHYVKLVGVERLCDAPAMESVFLEKSMEGTGWEVLGMDQLRHASRLDMRLRTVRYEIIPALLRNPADDSALRRLSGQAQGIRRIAKRSSGYLRTLAAWIENRFRSVAEKVLKSKRPPSWLADRLYGLEVISKKVHKRRYILL